MNVDVFAISTDTDYVNLDYKKPTQRPLHHVTVSEIQDHYEAGHFPPGSMGPNGVYRPGDHGSTFGGNPLGCAVARTASAELGAYFLRKLQGLCAPAVKEVRGKGLWLAIELYGAARLYCEVLREHGVLCKETHEHVIRIAPPLVI